MADAMTIDCTEVRAAIEMIRHAPLEKRFHICAEMDGHFSDWIDYRVFDGRIHQVLSDHALDRLRHYGLTPGILTDGD